MSTDGSVSSLARKHRIWVSGLIVALLAIPGWGAARAEGPFETPPVLSASSILPPELLRGPNFRVNEVVVNDGYLNRYTIRSVFGNFDGVTTSKLRKRIREIRALEAMEAINRAGVFKDSAIEAVGDVWTGIKGFVTSPVDTVSGAASGVGKMFGRAGEHLFGSKRSDQEDSRFKALIGFSKTKREYAYQFGVDVYSTNPVLQDRLNKIAWSGYAGGIGVSAMMSAVPGGTGILVSTAGGTRLMNEMLRTTAPVDLRQMNREKLEAMGIDPSLAELLVDNTVFTPRQQTALVLALEELGGVGNRELFVKFSILTQNQDVAFFRQRMAQMYAAYHAKAGAIDRFEQMGKGGPVAGLNFAVTKSGTVIFMAPLDYLVWTEDIARVFASLNVAADSVGSGGGKELWIAGTLSETARREIETSGWMIRDNLEATMLPPE